MRIPEHASATAHPHRGHRGAASLVGNGTSVEKNPEYGKAMHDLNTDLRNGERYHAARTTAVLTSPSTRHHSNLALHSKPTLSACKVGYRKQKEAHARSPFSPYFLLFLPALWLPRVEAGIKCASA